MKALSVWQPWASLLMAGIKSYETRGWEPPVDLMGTRILIHASATTRGIGHYNAPALRGTAARQEARARLGLDLRALPYGCILGSARLAFVLFAGQGLASDVLDDEKALGDWSPGRYAWRLTDHLPLDRPIPWRGQQGLFDIPDHILTQGVRA